MLRDSLPEFNTIRIAALLLRLSLAAGLLSAVADRFGLWGLPGAPMVAWGNITNFFAYVAKLNPWCPTFLIPALGWTATTLELVLGIALITGYRLRLTALLTAMLTTSFAISMTFTLGLHEPLNYSVFAFSASCYLLAAISNRHRESRPIQTTI